MENQKDTSKHVYVDDFIVGHCSAIQHISKNQHYISFGLACSAIEFIGKCLDEKCQFTDYDRSLPRKHFNLAIDTLMPKYSAANKEHDLFQSMRNCLLHTLVPDLPIWLRQKSNATEPHLTFKDEKLHLISEELADDVYSASLKIAEGIKNRTLKGDKLYKALLDI